MDFHCRGLDCYKQLPSPGSNCVNSLVENEDYAVLVDVMLHCMSVLGTRCCSTGLPWLVMHLECKDAIFLITIMKILRKTTVSTQFDGNSWTVSS